MSFTSLKRKLPPAWRELGKQVDNTFAGVANRAAEGNTTGVTEQMATGPVPSGSLPKPLRSMIEMPGDAPTRPT